MPTCALAAPRLRETAVLGFAYRKRLCHLVGRCKVFLLRRRSVLALKSCLAVVDLQSSACFPEIRIREYRHQAGSYNLRSRSRRRRWSSASPDGPLWSSQVRRGKVCSSVGGPGYAGGLPIEPSNANGWSGKEECGWRSEHEPEKHGSLL